MDKIEATEALHSIGLSLSSQLMELANSIHELQDRRNYLSDLWTARDYQGLRQAGFLSQRQFETLSAAFAVIERDE